MLLHRSLTRRATAVAGLVTAAAVVVAPAAQARTLVHQDRLHDVRVTSTETHHPSLTPAPRHRDGDIASVRITNGGVVGIRLAYDELKRTTGYRIDLITVVTNDSVVRRIEILSGPGFYTGTVDVTRANGDRVSCRVTHSVDYGANVLAVHVPRPCLGQPRSVRVGVITASLTSSFRLLFVDDALRDHTASLLFTPKLSDRVWLH
jgi:hypothetical protein